jgi:branched-chain amino acid transport system substrate-binding protein
MRNQRGLNNRARRNALLGVITAAALAMAGCGAAHPDEAASAAACTGPGVVPGQVTLGAVYPNTGASANVLATYRAGIDARFGVANAAGGINGRKVVYDWADDQGLATDNLGAARKLVNANHVFGIMELSTATAGGAAFLHAQGIPVVGPGLDPVWSRDTNMFSSWTTVSTGTPMSTWGDYVRAQGGTKAAILYSDLADATRILAGQWKASLAADGITSGTIEASPNITDPAEVAAEIKAGGYDTVTGNIDDTLYIQIAIAVKKTDPKVRIILSADGYSATLLGAVGKLIPGFTVYIPYLPFELNAPASNAFLAAMTRYSPQVQPSANEVALYGWLDADLMLTGLKAAGACPTRATFIRALRNVSGYTAGGLMASPVNFRTDFGQASRCLVFVTIDPTGTRWDVARPVPLCGHAVPTK